jgi:predicted porin
MKKSLLAIAAVAALGSLSSVAQAQSSVTLFGIVDAGFARVSGSNSKTGITNSGLNSSRLGFRGTEDLGGGLRAVFWIEGQLTNDDGNAAGLTFQRRSYVGLAGGFGEVRIGREYTPTFWNLTIFDPFGTNGVGQANTPGMLGSAGGTTVVRSSNAITYLLPPMGGMYGQVMYGFGEQVSNAANKSDNNYFGIRLGYASGPLDVSFATGKTKNLAVNNFTQTNFAGSYDFGMVKPMLVWAQEKEGVGRKVTALEIGATVPIGTNQLRAAYSRHNQEGGTAAFNANDWTKFAIGYGQNLSKRTQVYGTYARVSNKGTGVRSVTNNGLTGITVAPGGNSSGFEIGVRHVF